MNNFKIFIILALILTTVLVCVIKPEMHKRVLIGTSDFALVQEENYERQLATNPQSTQVQNTVKNQIAKSKAPLEQYPDQNQTYTQKNQQKAPVQSYTTGQLKDQDVFNPQGSHYFNSNNPPPPRPMSNQAPQTNANQRHQLTPEQEEIIAWNKWRSNLENQVLKDTEISAPIGTIFRFSFTVDKYGNISNLKTWSDNPQFTPTAVKSVKPVILSYQGKPILNFPPKSKRISTNAEGYFMTWTSTGYSTPADFSDYERIK